MMCCRSTCSSRRLRLPSVLGILALLQSVCFFLLSNRIIINHEHAVGNASRGQKEKQQQQQQQEKSTPKTQARRCDYEGNCPALTFCGTSGYCVPYLNREDIRDSSGILNESNSIITRSSGVTPPLETWSGGLRPITVSGDGTDANNLIIHPDPTTYTNAIQTSSNININATALTQCLHQCIIDIIWDERYYFLSTVNVTHYQPHLSPNEGPDGCVVIYERHGPSNIYHPKESWDVRQPTTEEWRERRAGVLVRRDAVPESEIDSLAVGKEQMQQQQQQQRWAVLCYNPCQVDADCIGKGLEQQQQQDISEENSGVGHWIRDYLSYFGWSRSNKTKRGRIVGASPTGISSNVASFQCNARASLCERVNKKTRSNYAFDREQGRKDIAELRQKLKNKQATAAVNSDASGNSRVDSSINSSTPVIQTSDLVVLSYANDSYMKGLSELAASLRYWAPHVRLCVYSLGLSADNIRTIEAWPNVIEVAWRDGYPDWMPAHAKQGKVYAWKSIAIREAVLQYRKILVFDAGSVIRGPLDSVEKILEMTGYFLVWGQDENMMPKAHEKTFEWFNYTKSTFVGGPHYGGGTQGHLYPSESFDNVVLPNFKCGIQKECIQPPGSNIGNHRYDQTSLSILSYQYHVMAQPHTEFLTASNPQQDFRQPSTKLIWTARGSSKNYFSSGY